MKDKASTNDPGDRVAYAKTMRADHAEAFEITDELIGLGEAFLRTVDVHRDDGLAIVKGTILLRLISGLEALSLLVSYGYYSEALGQKRSLLEALARLAALSKDPSLFDEYLMQDQLNRLKIIDDIIESRRSWPADMPRIPPDDELLSKRREIEAHIDEYNKSAPRKLRDIKTFDWAAKGKVDHLFLGHYTISSQALHHAPRDMERRLVIVDDKLLGISVGPEAGDVETLLLDSCKLVFVGLQWFAESIGLEVPAEIHALYERHQQICERLAAEAMGTP